MARARFGGMGFRVSPVTMTALAAAIVFGAGARAEPAAGGGSQPSEPAHAGVAAAADESIKSVEGLAGDIAALGKITDRQLAEAARHEGELADLTKQVDLLISLLGEARGTRESLRFEAAALTEEIAASSEKRRQTDAILAALRAERDNLSARVGALTGEGAAAALEMAGLRKNLELALAAIDEERRRGTRRERDIARLEEQAEKVGRRNGDLGGEVEALRGAKAGAEKRLAALTDELETAEARSARREAEIAALTARLETAETRSAGQQVKITALTARLDAALAARVDRLERYRSEFFGRLREIIGDRKEIRVVGDRFVFQSEILFASGSAELGVEGRRRLVRLAETLTAIAARIPPGLDWILRVDGHTDRLPIATDRFPSNWDLSAARALSVVRYLIDQGVAPGRLAAAGFGEHNPIDPREDEIAYRRNRRIEFKLTQR